MEANGIGLHQLPAVRRRDAVLVDIVLLEAGDEQLKRFAVHHALHDIRFGIPAVEIADNGHALRVRRPDAEHVAFLAVLFQLVRPENFVYAVILAVMVEVEREIGLLAQQLIFVHGTPFSCISAKILYLVVQHPHRTSLLYYILS